MSALPSHVIVTADDVAQAAEWRGLEACRSPVLRAFQRAMSGRWPVRLAKADMLVTLASAGRDTHVHISGSWVGVSVALDPPYESGRTGRIELVWPESFR